MGLNDYFEKNYEITIKNLSKILGSHYPPIPGVLNVNIFINSSIFKTDSLFVSRSSDNGTSDYEDIKLLVSVLAHELYHVIQVTIFNQSFTKRVAEYIRPENNLEDYEKQFLEVGANLFAEKYIDFVLSNNLLLANILTEC